MLLARSIFPTHCLSCGAHMFQLMCCVLSTSGFVSNRCALAPCHSAYVTRGGNAEGARSGRRQAGRLYSRGLHLVCISVCTERLASVTVLLPPRPTVPSQLVSSWTLADGPQQTDPADRPSRQSPAVGHQ